MNKRRKKSTEKHPKKQGSKQARKKISWFPLGIALGLLIVVFFVFMISKSVIRNTFYKNYITYIEKTKVVLYPDITEKDKQANLNSWMTFMKRFLHQYPKDLSLLTTYIPKIEIKGQENKWEEVNGLVLETRSILLKIVKNKNYYTQTIMMEDLLSLILDMEKSVGKKDDLLVMEQYQNFNSKFTFVIPGLIKSDVVLVGDRMDRLYKLALLQNKDGLEPLYKEIKSAFTKAYRDYKAK
jgi:hypothetical protein